MSKITLDLSNCVLYYRRFITPNLNIMRESTKSDWLMLYGGASNGVLYLYRLYTGDKPTNKKCDVSRYPIETKYNKLEFRIGTYYRLDEFIDELGELVMTDELIPTYDLEGYHILPWTNTNTPNYIDMTVNTFNIGVHDDAVGGILSAITMWRNKVSISHNNTYAGKPTSWSAHSETYKNQFVNVIKFAIAVHEDQEISKYQDDYIIKLISEIITKTYDGIVRYNKKADERYRSGDLEIGNMFDALDPDMYY